MFKIFKKKTTIRQFYNYSCRYLIGAALGILNNQDEAENIVLGVYRKIATDYKRYKYMDLKHQTSLALIVTREACAKYLDNKNGISGITYAGDEEFPSEIDEKRSNSILAKCDKEMISEILGKIDFRLKDVLVLRYYYDMNFKEMGRMLSTSSKDMERRLETANRILHKEVENELRRKE